MVGMGQNLLSQNVWENKPSEVNYFRVPIGYLGFWLIAIEGAHIFVAKLQVSDCGGDLSCRHGHQNKTLSQEKCEEGISYFLGIL